DRRLERECAGSPDDPPVFPGRVDALQRQVLREALDALRIRLEREVLADCEDRLAELVQVGARRDLETHSLLSSGAQSTMSRRSLPSSKRTVTMPPGSSAVTTPSPSDAWRTLSPVETRTAVPRRAAPAGCP